MAQATSIGFLTPDAEDFILSEPEVFIDGERIDGGNSIPNWNYNADIVVRCELKANLPDALQNAGLQPNDGGQPSVLSAALTWFSTSTRARGSSDRVILNDGPNQLEVTIFGELAGGDLLIRPVVILEKNSLPADHPLPTAARLGSLLWDTEIRIPLEGSGTRMRTDATSFSSTGVVPANAMWKVVFSGDLGSHALRGVRVLLNTDHETTKQALSHEGSAVSKSWNQQLECDTLTQMLIFALCQDPDDLIDAAETEDTLAETLVNLVQSIMNSSDLHSLAQEFRIDPTRVFDAANAHIYGTNAQR